MNMEKPLGKKSYGSIPHLLESKMGIGDKRIEKNQHNYICNTHRKNDILYVTEKLDGSCVSVAKINGEIIALTRAGYLAKSSQYKQHLYFDKWANDNAHRFDNLLKDGERIAGEWLLQTHGTIINLVHEPFVPFDILVGSKRIPYRSFLERTHDDFVHPSLIHVGENFSLESIRKSLITKSPHGQEKREGVVCRIETNGEFNFIAKYVRDDFIAGKYMKEEIFNNNWERWM